MTVAIEKTLAPEQEEVAQLIEHWYQNYDEVKDTVPYFVLAGYAGTGKTYMTKQIIERLGVRARFMAYTGKAALVMRMYNNLPAQTIHSAIYTIDQVSDEVFKDLYERRDNATSEQEKLDITREINELLVPKFRLKHEAFYDEDSGKQSVDLIVLDECSMVDDAILGDLLSFNIPILALGDPGQLPPVKGEGALFKSAPSAQLTKIHRQAADNPIIKWATWARTGRPFPRGQTDENQETGEGVSCINGQRLAVSDIVNLMTEHDMTICWRNTTLKDLNTAMRRKKGYHKQDPIYPVVGETLVIRKNDREVGVFNGLFAEVVEVGDLLDTYIELYVRTELQEPDAEPKLLKVLRACFDEYNVGKAAWEELKRWDYKGKQLVDYGYAITCHRAQGSQWPKVLVLDDKVLSWPKVREERKRWIYTAVTRAVQKLTVVAH